MVTRPPVGFVCAAADANPPRGAAFALARAAGGAGPWAVCVEGEPREAVAAAAEGLAEALSRADQGGARSAVGRAFHAADDAFAEADGAAHDAWGGAAAAWFDPERRALQARAAGEAALWMFPPGGEPSDLLAGLPRRPRLGRGAIPGDAAGGACGIPFPAGSVALIASPSLLLALTPAAVREAVEAHLAWGGVSDIPRALIAAAGAPGRAGLPRAGVAAAAIHLRA